MEDGKYVTKTEGAGCQDKVGGLNTETIICLLVGCLLSQFKMSGVKPSMISIAVIIIIIIIIIIIM